MSVHGEYGRALETLLVSLNRIDTPEASEWSSALVGARVSENPDLSVAASACMTVLDAIDAARSLSGGGEIGPDLDPLREPYSNLRAHCRAVLGTSAETKGVR